MPRFKFLFLEPFYGGSHRAFADGLIANSAHDIRLLGMPARFWKWRMRGAALHFLKKMGPKPDCSGIIASSLMSIADLKALMGPGCPPILVYFHENQLTYPLAPGEKMDYQYGFTNITSALAADRILFNSQTHFDAFFSMLPRFIGMMPEYTPLWAVEKIRRKSSVLHPGCRLAHSLPEPAGEAGRAPLIVWNHRWEFDKKPEVFFDAMITLKEEGFAFELAILGERFRQAPGVFGEAAGALKDRIVQFGYASTIEAYHKWLTRGDLVVSTAIQENFGIAVVEAVGFGCFPLLPNRLSYPEIIPRRYHHTTLYDNQAALLDRLREFLSAPGAYLAARRALAREMNNFSWKSMIPRYDAVLAQLGTGPCGD